MQILPELYHSSACSADEVSCLLFRGSRGSDSMSPKSGRRVRRKPLPELAMTRDRSKPHGGTVTSAPPLTQSSSEDSSARQRAPARHQRILFILFLCSLPLVNPTVHGDGVGYYADARAPLIQHNLRFEQDWLRANLLFSQTRTLPNGQLSAAEYTETGYISNLYSVGPAFLWAP